MAPKLSDSPPLPLDVRMISLRCQSLPPMTHTNAYLIGGSYLLDPGPTDSDEQRKLFDILDADQAGHHRLTAVVLTHHHPDHIGAAILCAQRYNVPVWAHPLTAQSLRGKVEIHRELADGERLEFESTDGERGRRHLQTIHTPGHARGHLAFYDPHHRFLYAGDMVSTLSSIIIAPPDGDLRVYLESLHRLRTFDCRLLLPAHGQPSDRPLQTLDECIAHRAKREQQLLSALGGSTPHGVPELTEELYRGIPSVLMRFAELQVLAGLQKLEREGRAQQAGAGTWLLRTSTSHN